MTLHNNSLKLAGLYLSIIMFISLFFSFAVYQLSTQELDRGIRGPEMQMGRGPERGLSKETRQALRIDAEQRSDLAKTNVKNRLIFINLFILVGAGFLSYYLAARTLRPIEEAHEAQSRFTADASHELRTPIAAMRSETEVAMMNPKLSVSQAKKLMASNLEELDKLTALTGGLLQLASNEHSKIEMTEVDLEEAIKQAQDRIKLNAKVKNLTINAQVAPDVYIQANTTALVDMLVILLDNAIKYSPENSKIDLSAQKNRKSAVIRITDYGIGISQNDKLHIVERFYRADTARSKQQTSGYGIGLSIAKQIVEVHQGTISVESKLGEGSTFVVSLPLAA